MASFQPGGGDVTGSVPAPPPPSWSWDGGTAITVEPGETLETISRRHNVPVAVIMQANHITSPGAIHPGEHLVIPKYRAPATAMAPPEPRVVSTVPAAPRSEPRPEPAAEPRAALTPGEGIHVVVPGETLHSIARVYGKPVQVIAKANNIAPDTMVRVGQRLVIPGAGETARAAPPPPPAPSNRDVATAESPHSARVATTAGPAPESAVKTAAPAGALPTFSWPVRGRIIATFGPKPNGLQNDGINLAVPEGTPIRAAEDGVVAYAGNELKGYGNLVLLRHANGYVTAYAHASEVLVKNGETVKRGQVIAKSGETGNVTSPQLHFEIRKGATPVDPAQFLNGA